MNEPKTKMPELMRDCQRKGGDTYKTRMVIWQVETRRAAIEMRSALNRLGGTFQLCADAIGRLTKARRKR